MALMHCQGRDIKNNEQRAHKQTQHVPSWTCDQQAPWAEVGSSVFQTIDAAAAKSLQSCPPLCDPIDGSPPGSPVPGILQARALEWAAISFSNACK